MRLLKKNGFTLIEMMITLAVMSILVGMVAPGLSELYRISSYDSVQNTLISSLQYARSEAVKRGTPTYLCPSDDGAACNSTSSDWSQGWLIFADNDWGGAFNTGDTLLKIKTMDESADIRWSIGSVIRFNGDGSFHGSGSGYFTICSGESSSLVKKSVQVSLAGRVRSKSSSVICL